MAAELEYAKRAIVSRKGPWNINTQGEIMIFLFNHLLENRYNSTACDLLNFYAIYLVLGVIYYENGNRNG